jgi:tetratricopeptide (TPR) repeat protein
VDVGLFVQNDEADTESKLTAAAEHAPDNAPLHTALAIRYVERGEWNEAADHFHRSARISPANGLPTWMWAALMYCHCGEWDRYHALTAEIIERFGNKDARGNIDYDGVITVPINDLNIFTRACLLAEPTQENLPGIERMVNRGLELQPDRTLSKLAKALWEYRKGDPQTAIDWAQTCPAGDRLVAVIKALAYAETGQIELAREQMAAVTAGHDARPFHTIIRQNDEAHETAFLEILLDELKRKLSAEERRAGKA